MDDRTKRKGVGHDQNLLRTTKDDKNSQSANIPRTRART